MNSIRLTPSSLEQKNISLIEGVDYVEFYVGNALQAAHFYRTSFGFSPIAYTSLETGTLDCSSWVLKQNNIYLVFTSSLDPNNAIADHVARHGDGVKNIAFRVRNTLEVFEKLIQKGAVPIQEPTREEDNYGELISAAVGGIGNSIHSLIERQNYQGVFAPNYQKIENPPPSVSIGVKKIDHIALCVKNGELDQYCDLYREVFGFHQSYQMDFVNGGSGMNSKVMENDSGTVKFTLCEPILSENKSQIDEYLHYNGGSGVQHLAFLSDNMVDTIGKLLSNGVEMLRNPDNYYEALPQRVGKIKEDLATLHQLQILADRDRDGYLLQAFTKIVQDRPTFFLEIIQRYGTSSFGQGNVKALFEAVKCEQQKRENC